MNILYLDLASSEGSLALVTETEIVEIKRFEGRVSEKALVEGFEDILKKAGWTYADLTHLSCVLGPGGFTSLRVGVSSMNALGYALEIPKAGIHLSSVYEQLSAVSCPTFAEASVGRQRSAIWLHSTKRDLLFGRIMSSFDTPSSLCHAECFGEAKKYRSINQRELGTQDDMIVFSLDELQECFCDHNFDLFTGELIPEHREIVEAAGLREAELAPLEEVLPGMVANLNYSKDLLKPWYGRGW